MIHTVVKTQSVTALAILVSKSLTFHLTFALAVSFSILVNVPKIFDVPFSLYGFIFKHIIESNCSASTGPPAKRKMMQGSGKSVFKRLTEGSF